MATSRAAKDGNTQKKILPTSEEIPETPSNAKPSIQNWVNMFGGATNKRAEPGPPPAQHWLLQMIADQEKRKQSAAQIPKKPTRFPCPEETSGCFSRLSFWWLMPLLRKGFKDSLSHDDLWTLTDSEEVANLVEKFDAAIKTRGVLHSLLYITRGKLLFAFFCCAIKICCEISAPLLITALVTAVEESSSDDDISDFSFHGTYKGLYLSVVFFLIQLLLAASEQHHLHSTFRAAVRIRSCAMGVVYREAMTLSQIDMTAGGESSRGKILNLMSNDAQKLCESIPLINMLWMGWAGVVGIGCSYLCVALYFFIGRCLGRARRSYMKFSDKRVRLCSEVMQSMKIVKFFCWESSFINLISSVRKEELRASYKQVLSFATFVMTLILMPVLAVVATFTAHVLMGNELTAPNAIASLAWFTVLRFPIQQAGEVATAVVSARVASARLTNFLAKAKAAKQRQKDRRATPGVNSSGSMMANITSVEANNQPTPRVSITGSSFSWPVSKSVDGGDKSPESQESQTQMKIKSTDAMDTTTTVAETEQKFTLEGVTLHMTDGDLVAVCGAVGSGKSTLVESLIGETVLCGGDAPSITGRVAYVPQTAWIRNATVRANIVFHHPWDEEWYQQCIQACALTTDIALLDNGDLTEIGERGVTLSGGQKQRVSLARAAYSRADIYLMDDPLSALDVHTAREIFEHLIGPHGLLADKARLLVTHATQFLSQCTQVLVLHAGQVRFSGTHDHLVQFAKQNSTQNHPSGHADAPGGDSPGGDLPSDDSPGGDSTESAATSDVNHPQKFTLPTSETAVQITPRAPGGGNGNDIASTVTFAAFLSSLMAVHQEKSSEKIEATPGVEKAITNSLKGGSSGSKLVKEEHRERGTISCAVLWLWLSSAGGVLYCIPWFSILTIERATYIFEDIWLATWTTATGGVAMKNNTLDGLIITVFNLTTLNANYTMEETVAINQFYMITYISLFGSCAVLVICRMLTMVTGGWLASKKIFRQVLHAVMHSPMSFFESTPSGRIINRFSYDTELTDFLLIRLTNASVASGFWLASSIVMMVVLSSGALLAVVIPACIVFYFVSLFYRRSCRELQRLDAVSRSPIHAHYAETLNGLSTIKSYGMVDNFVADVDRHINRNNEALLLYFALMRWLDFYLMTLGAVITGSTALVSWLLRDSMSGGMAGVMILWSINFTTATHFVTLNATEGEAKFSSVERLKAYIALPSEAAMTSDPDKVPPKTWPQVGHLVFDDVKMRYRPGLPLALRGLSCEINAGERVGVVGRTGAGKSSIAIALLRLVEIEGGRIILDGVDLATLGLEDVRSRAMCIIPQDPTLFSGTVRSNLDPFGEHGEAQLSDALARVRLLDVVQSLPGGLDAVVENGGLNWSAGQRQLICLARALLRQPKVLILDEATASVDGETDAFIGGMIRTEFQNTTMIIIAHRLHTIMHADKIMVMDAGRCVELASPQDLLGNSESLFSGLVDATGPATAADLRQMAFNVVDTSS